MIIAILLAIVITAAFIVMIPAVCQGFPTPVISHVQLSGASPAADGTLAFSVNTMVTNEGTGGNVVIITKLVNASRNSVEGRSTKILYMTAGEKRSIRTMVNGPAGTPHLIVVEAERKTAINAGS